MRNKIKRLALLLSVLLLLFSFSPFVPADFGDYAGDSDYGYDSYDSYDSYDYDDDDDDDRYDYGGSYGGSGGSGGSGSAKSAYYTFAGYPADQVWYGGALPADYLGRSVAAQTLTGTPLDPEDDKGAGAVALALLLGIAAIVAVIVQRVKHMDDPDYSGGSGQKRSGGKRSGTGNGMTRSVPAGAQPTPQSQLKNISAYYKFDPGFSETELTEKLSNWYVRFQNAWQAKDLEELRPCLTDAFYAQMDRQLDVYRQKKQTPHVERIAVLDVSLSGWKQSVSEDVMVARLRTRITDYVTDDATGKIVRGSDTAEKFMEYEWTLTRRRGIRTGVNDGVRVQNCPNCGGAVNINRTARCPYCDSIITVDAADWAVSAIKGLSQRTAGR